MFYNVYNNLSKVQVLICLDELVSSIQTIHVPKWVQFILSVLLELYKTSAIALILRLAQM